MANVYKRAGDNGKATWCIRYRDPSGKDVRKATDARTKREAEAILVSILKDLSDRVYEVKQRQREVTFFEICDDFMAYGKARKRSWKRDQEHIVHLKSFFGKCLARDIKPAGIEEYITFRRNSITSRGRPPAVATINRELACLRTIYNKAIQNDKCVNNPMNHIQLFKENNKRDRVLSNAEYERLLGCSPDHLRPIFITAYETGMRAREIFTLTWEQIDFERGFIFLKAEMIKTNEGRKVPISPVLHQTLSQIGRNSGPVFQYKGKPIKCIKESFHKACQLAEISGFLFHDFRHTFVTNMRKAGKQDRVIMAITGHKTMSAFARYDTIDEDDLRMAVMNMESSEILGTNLAHQ